MELLKKLELSMEDVRMLQAEAKKGRAAQNTSGADSKNTSGDAARQNVSAKNKAKTARTADKTASTSAIRIRRWDAHWQQPCRNDFWMQTMAEPTKRSKPIGAVWRRSIERCKCVDRSRCRQQHIRQPEDSSRFLHWNAASRTRKKLAEELGIGEITLTDIVMGAESLPAIRVRICPARSCAATCWI